jgi:hypothetical protein
MHSAVVFLAIFGVLASAVAPPGYVYTPAGLMKKECVHAVPHESVIAVTEARSDRCVWSLARRPPWLLCRRTPKSRHWMVISLQSCHCVKVGCLAQTAALETTICLRTTMVPPVIVFQLPCTGADALSLSKVGWSTLRFKIRRGWMCFWARFLCLTCPLRRPLCCTCSLACRTSSARLALIQL